MKRAVEAARKKNHIAQCTRCQSYGHTKRYCSRSYVCVKCWGEHNTNLCTKDPIAPATCALCGGEHPASYKGCVIYKDLQQAQGKTHRSNHLTATQTSTPPVNINDASQFPLPYKLHPVPAPEPPTFPSFSPYSYIATHHQQPINLAEQLSTFLNEFKPMFGQLIQQNGLI